VRAVLFVLAAAGAVAVGLATLVVAYGRDLPAFDALTDYHPPQVTRVMDRTGQPVAELFHERRTVVPSEAIPKVLKEAVVAAEDGHFYEHHGLDYLGILRALLKDLRELRLAQGASTITQQVVKNMVLSPERSLARKVKEAILARRIEQNLSKEEILWLYLNHIYFGHHRYGVEEASRFYFGKSVGALSLGEAALLAGLPQSPARLSPLRAPEKAKARQTYVLNQMAQNHFITQAQADAEIARPLSLAKESFAPVGPYYAEAVRLSLLERYGEKDLYEGGLRVEVGMDARLQALCDASLRSGLEALDHRYGYRAAQVQVDDATLAAARPALLSKLSRPLVSRDAGPRPVPVWDFSTVAGSTAASPERLGAAVSVRALAEGLVLRAPVESVSDKEAVVDLGPVKGVLAFDGMRWARPYAPGRASASPRKATDVLLARQLVRVRVLALPGPIEHPKGQGAEPVAQVPLALEQEPLVQGALVAIDPSTRHVVALSGGYDFGASAFNRAVQAKRQPGSAFKPFVYAAAIMSGRFTAASLVNDAPELIRDPSTGKEWRPRNFERDAYDGPLSLRTALSRSKNTVSVRLIEAVGPRAVIDVARRSGVGSPLPDNMTLALGTGEVTPLELTNAYATLASNGRHAEALLVLRVTDAAGKVLEEHHAVPEETIPPAVAYVTTSLMRSVVEGGTGVRARELARPVAAKTGTASGHRDTWFAGYTPDLVTTAWVGFDDHAPLGSAETGGHAALPIWLAFMKGALEGRPKLEFPVPAGVESVRIDPMSGLRARDDAPGRAEVFVEGTAPTEVAPRPGEANKDELFLEDGGKARP
jgi:penicillin-binding protein 1A